MIETNQMIDDFIELGEMIGAVTYADRKLCATVAYLKQAEFSEFWFQQVISAVRTRKLENGHSVDGSFLRAVCRRVSDSAEFGTNFDACCARVRIPESFYAEANLAIANRGKVG